MLEQLLPELFKNQNDIYHRQRRRALVDEMNLLEDKKLSCAQCVGNCCTFTSNSMRVTPLEAVEILLFLQKEGRLNKDLTDLLKNNVLEFRLDKETLFGIKKNYTCPFYLGKCKGCSISRWSKPYGCLAFNATEENVLEGKSCQSNQSLLEKRNNEFKQYEETMNSYIKKVFNLPWEKESIPIALLEIIKKGELCSPL